MFKETQSVKELHRIREELYNETRYMKPEDRISYLNKEADKVRHLLRTKQTIKA